jgi:hypothetical protein
MLSYFIENPQHYAHDSIGSFTEKILHSSLFQLYLLFKSIIVDSSIIPENSTLETMIIIVESNFLKNKINFLNNIK